MADPIKARFDIAFENPGRAVVLAQDLVTLIQCVCTGAATAKAVGVGIGSRFLDRIETKQVERLHGTVGQGWDAQRTKLGWVVAFRNVDAPEWLRLVTVSAKLAESRCFQLRAVPDFAVHTGGGCTLIGGHAHDGRGAATVRVGEQINQCMDFTPSALLSCLHDTRLEPTDIAPDLAPVDGVPVRNSAGSRTSKRCRCKRFRRRHICFAPRVSWARLSRDERPEGSLPAFAVGDVALRL